MFNDIYRDKHVFVTGHTGFKGSWFCLWLQKLGARVTGYSLSPPTQPNHFELLQFNGVSIIGDIRDYKALREVVCDTHPDIVFHFAAQSLVRRSYKYPLETFETNILGTSNLLNACRRESNLKAIVIVTSDKCYANREWVWGYRETDALGGFDPYSCSKGCAELITASYRHSFFNSTGKVLLASVRSGNVIGGGDWAQDRLVPDLVHSASQSKTIELRNPTSVRPWQHVLDPLSGYLLLGQRLIEGKIQFADAWNIGPSLESSLTVRKVADIVKEYWNAVTYKELTNQDGITETHTLGLDSSKARNILGWRTVWKTKTAIRKTVEWYKNYYEKNSVVSAAQLNDYIENAIENQCIWANE